MEKRNKRDNYRNRDSRLSNNRKVFDGFGKNLNAYGYCPEGRYENDKLDFLKDEHIWREMDIIPKSSK